ncbi:hypothetical protein CP533_0112 [Ophiocordyceps camponoti-saundersi (nom. inval.)]|nr:hypothetical protein CP533_0112 [Ophiocordyceps camponoti-saundersi (nom. inval.)]
MQFTAAVILAVAAVASATSPQGLSELPACAQHCVTDAAKGNTSCDGKLDCICSHMPDLVSTVGECVFESCGKDVAIHDALPKGLKICAKHQNAARQVECVPVQVATQTSAQVVTTTVGPRPTASVVTAGAGAVGPAGGLAALAVAAALL